MKVVRMLSTNRRIAATVQIALLLGLLPAMTALAGGDEVEASGAAAQVQIQLGEWRSDLPPGISLIVNGGQLINRSFPAISADRTWIAVLYHAGHPLVHGYPTLDIYSVSSLSLQERMEFLPSEPTGKQDPNLLDQALLGSVEQRVREANHYLAQGSFHPVDKLFELPWNEPASQIENAGKRINYDASVDPPELTIASISTRQTVLRMQMPRVVPTPSPYVDHDDDCGAQGFPAQGWYDHQLNIVVLRLTFPSARDGCEHPEHWVLKRI